MALDMFMQFKTPDAKGESKDSVYKDAIDVLAWSWGASNSGTAHMAGGAGAGKPSFQDLSFTKYVDNASNVLLTALAKGQHFGTVTLTMRKSGEGQKPYYVVTMSQVIITSYSTGGSGGEDRLTENVTLNFAKAVIKYSTQNEKGVLAAGTDFGWNIEENKEDKA